MHVESDEYIPEKMNTYCFIFEKNNILMVYVKKTLGKENSIC